MSADSLIQPRRLTLSVATVLPAEEWEDIPVSDLDLSNSERRRTAELRLWLCGVSATAKEAALVGNEVLGDAGLIVALNLPAAEFLRWFRHEDWSCFDSTERTGSEAWAWEVLQRAWGACEALGTLALQCPLTAPD